MKATSVKRVLGLAAAAVGTSGAMMFAPAVTNAATAHPAHAQAVSSVSATVQPNYRHPHRYYRGYRGGYGGYRGGYGGYRGGYGGYRGGYGGYRGGYRGGYGGYRGGYGGYRH